MPFGGEAWLVRAAGCGLRAVSCALWRTAGCALRAVRSGELRVERGHAAGQPRPGPPADVVSEDLHAARLQFVQSELGDHRRVTLRGVDMADHVGIRTAAYPA